MNDVKHYQQLHEKNIFLPSLPLMKNSGVIYFELMPYSDDQEYIKRVGWHTQLFAEYYGFDSVFSK